MIHAITPCRCLQVDFHQFKNALIQVLSSTMASSPTQCPSTAPVPPPPAGKRGPPDSHRYRTSSPSYTWIDGYFIDPQGKFRVTLA